MLGNFTNSVLPVTDKFVLKGRVKKDEAIWNVDIASAHIGSSDLYGKFRYDPRPERPSLKGELRGKRLYLADLFPAFGTRTGEGEVVKPRRGGSSVGCSIARSPQDLADALARAHLWEEEALVEALVPGIEVTGAVLHDPAGETLALPPVEIRPRRGAFFDYDEKYSSDGALELCPSESLEPAAVERVREAALLAHRSLGCEGYSRSDFIVPVGESEPVFLETNTLPGLTPRSLLPKAAAAVGIARKNPCFERIVTPWLKACTIIAARE